MLPCAHQLYDICILVSMPCWGNSWKWRSNTLLDLTLCAEAEFGRWITLLFEATSAKFDFGEIMSRLSRWLAFIQVWKEIFLFFNQTKINHWGFPDMFPLIGSYSLPTVFGHSGGDSNHFQGTMVMLWRSGTLWGLVAGVRTSMVMNRAAKKNMYFFQTYIHLVEPESNLTFPSAFDSYFYIRCWTCV